jgi:hypothetical protein
MGGKVGLFALDGVLFVPESAQHFARVPGPWLGTFPNDHGLPLEKQPAVGRQRPLPPAKATRTGENSIVLVPALVDKSEEAQIVP